ncbi:putative bifunctional diguanylate cyclase/phosphodiesterase [Geodermatophilus sp. URMC 62]|uniref:putative bifunctional diguanylate cyclase/phosphodiesterase n=1 Tax=Geodermatophilus sp. URMC 62 TaxID=3423414 RepID=UPI00406D3E0B
MSTWQGGRTGDDTQDRTAAEVPDRGLVLDRLTAALTAGGHPTALLLVDLDHFGLVNTARGHDVGDRLLAAVGARLRAAVSGSDTVVRSGDDEFVVVCEQTGEHSAYALACFLRNLLTEPHRLDGAAVQVTASIGVAVAEAGSAVGATELLRRAASAVTAGKGSGGGRVRVFEPEADDRAASRHALAADLPVALAAGELTVEYQPIVDLRSGAVVGVEALARWTHPEHGPVPATTFVGAAELTGLAPQLDGWVVQRALQDMARLRAAGAVPSDAHLAVNLSTGDLTDTALPDRLLGWTQRCGLPPGQLVLEVTETAVMQDAECAVRVLRSLRDRGFGVAMDDFGTGYSSLAHLRDLPVSAVKIDPTFVADVTVHRDALAIVAFVVDLARAVGVAVVAEGVETAEQAATLRALGCVTAQGWLWGPAVPPAALLDGRARTAPHPPGRDAARTRGAGHPAAGGPDAHGVHRLLQLHRDGASIDTIATALGSEGFRSPAGRRWHPAAVARLIAQRIRRSVATTPFAPVALPPALDRPYDRPAGPA